MPQRLEEVGLGAALQRPDLWVLKPEGVARLAPTGGARRMTDPGAARHAVMTTGDLPTVEPREPPAGEHVADQPPADVRVIGETRERQGVGHRERDPHIGVADEPGLTERVPPRLLLVEARRRVDERRDEGLLGRRERRRSSGRDDGDPGRGGAEETESGDDASIDLERTDGPLARDLLKDAIKAEARRTREVVGPDEGDAAGAEGGHELSAEAAPGIGGVGRAGVWW